MSAVRTRRAPEPKTLGAAEAAAYLGVKSQTLYAYVSRGWLRSLPSARGRARRYLLEELRELKGRGGAGGEAVGDALRWGRPLFESSIARISAARGPIYRGRAAVEFALADLPFESVAELLWEGDAGAAGTLWDARELGVRQASLTALLPGEATLLDALALLLPSLSARDAARMSGDDEAQRSRARAIVRRMAAALALPLESSRVTRALRRSSVAGVVAAALGKDRKRPVVRAINRALILCADHELNTSTFAARVTASTGADLYACLGAALAALSGPRHGGACDRIEALFREIAIEGSAATVVRERARRGEVVPGFAHPLYPDGDPRSVVLMQVARKASPRHPVVTAARRLERALGESGEPASATIDTGLVVLSAALGLPPGSASAIFAVGRAAGWVAHVLEQRRAGFLARPRARYIGI